MMKLKNILTASVAAFAASVLLVFAGCSDLSEPTSNSSSAKTAQVTFSLGTAARTVLPNVDLENGYTFTVTTTPQGSSTATKQLENKTYAELTAANTIALAAGTYTFTVKATNTAKGAALQGSTTTTIVNGSNTVSVKLSDAVTNGTGTVDVTLNYTKNAGVMKIYAYWGETMPTSAVSDGTSLYSTDGTVTFSKSDVTSGKTYYIAFYFYNANSELLATSFDTVYVVAGYNSTATKIVKISKTLGVYPENGATDAYADTQLILTFTSAPTLVADKNVKIYTSAGTLIDTITINSTSADESQSTQSGYTVNVGNKQLVRVDGNKVYIQPHYGKLSWGTSYYVDIDAGAITGASTLYGGTAWNGFSGAEGWKFTTKAEPTLNTTVTVSNNISKTADFFSVYGAMAAVANKTSGTYEIQIEPGTYYELVSIQSKGANMILKGKGTAQYGSDVVIEYVNNVHMNNSTHTRPSFYFKGSGNLTFENVTLKNLTQRKTSYTKDGLYGGNDSNNYQAEAFYYACTTGFVNAYNSSFISLQDTICTNGSKMWFYGCHIEGDVDFMWGTSTVALFEKCDIRCVYDSNSNGNAYLFETRVGSQNDTTIGKGYVLFNSNVTVDSGVTAYYARRASAVGASNNYYDQSALVNVVFTSAPNEAHYSVGKVPYALTGTLYGDYADVGWKEYNVTVNGSAVGTTARYAKSGDITATEYEAEYSGRRAILNRYYDITNKKYARDTVANFAVDKLISTRGYNVSADLSAETSAGGTSETTVLYDFTALTGYTAQTSYVTSVSPTTGTGNDVTLKTNGWKWHGSQYGLCNSGSTPWTMTVPVTGACTISITNSYNVAATVTLPANVTGDATLTANKTTTYTYNGTNSANLEFSFTSSGTFYISKIAVTYTNAGGISVAIAGDTSVAVGESITLTATASAATSGSWSWQFETGSTSSSAELTVATQTTTSSTATIKGLTAGTVKVYAIVDGVVSNAYSVKVNAAGVVYDIDVVPGAKVTTNGWADMANSGAGMKYPDTTNVIVINNSTYPTAKAKLTAFTNAIASGSVSSSSVNSTAAIIVVDGEIDLSVNTITSGYTVKTWFAEFDSTSHKRKHEDIVYDIGSNKTIIGVNAAKLSHGGLRIYAKSGQPGENIIIRNVEFSDAHGSTEYDTSVEAYKSNKASADALVIEASGGSSGDYTYIPQNIWIDHCKFSDGDCRDMIRNYNHDGAFDMKGGKNVTVSYCEFTNHDKVTLLAPNDDYTSPEQRQITFHHIYYHDTVQRTPRSRGCQLHMYNCYWNQIGFSGTDDNGTGSNGGFMFGPGIGSQYIVENCYLGDMVTSGAKKLKYFDTSAEGSSATTFSKFYQNGNNYTFTGSADMATDGDMASSVADHLTTTKPWTPAYSYENTMVTYSEVQTLVPAAAGVDKAGYSKNIRVNGVGY